MKSPNNSISRGRRKGRLKANVNNSSSSSRGRLDGRISVNG
jgi:hypothetical protein